MLPPSGAVAPRPIAAPRPQRWTRRAGAWRWATYRTAAVSAAVLSKSSSAERLLGDTVIPHRASEEPMQYLCQIYHEERCTTRAPPARSRETVGEQHGPTVVWRCISG